MTELVWLYDVAEVQAATLADPLGLELDERLQDSEMLRFTLRADDPKATYVDNDRVVKYRDRLYRITELNTIRAGSAVTYDVGADALWIDLLGFPAYTTPITGATISQGLGYLLSGTGWTTGTVDSDGGHFSVDTTNDTTVLAQLRSWAVMTGRELTFDTANRAVNLVMAQGVNRGLGFRYGRNLISVKRKATPPLATRLYAYGASNLSIAAVNPTGKPYVDNFSYYTAQGLSLATAQAKYLKVTRWQDERYLLALNLYDAAVAKLAKLAQPTVAYELAVVDLAHLVPTLEQIDLGDTVRVDDGPTGISLNTRVVRKVTRPLEPARTEVELSYLQPGITTTSATSGSGGSSNMGQLVSLNASPLNVGGASQVNLNQIDIGVDTGSQANLIYGFELDATATGTGTLQVAFYYGSTLVGATVQVPFVAGPVHVSVADFLVGLTTSGAFYAKASIVAGSGSLTVPGNTAHLYVLGSGMAGGGSNGATSVDVAESVTITASGVTDAGATTQLHTPIDGSPTGESVDATPDTITETVTAVTTP